MRCREHKKRNRLAADAFTTRLVWAGVAALSVLTWGTATEAALVAQFTGTVTSMSSPLVGGFTVGESVAGSYRFDETTSDANGSTNIGVYPAIDDYQVQFSGGYVVSATTGEISVRVPPLGEHSYRATTTSPSGPSVSGLVPTFMGLVLEDSSQIVLGSEALPTSLDLGDFDFRVFQLSFGEEFVNVDLATFAIIPEPATLALLGLSVLVLVGRRR